ncbi:MAG: hypothetical protein KC589_09100 [Nanoarchaeota archaeon]|nr:hypothetical protein [Nanoarchaeota archaeon]
MFFEELLGIHTGKTIAVLGSAPSLNDYKDRINSESDIVIACNGSILALDPEEHFVDYFAWYDGRVSSRSWFNLSENFLVSGSDRLGNFYDGTKKICSRLTNIEPISNFENNLLGDKYLYQIINISNISSDFSLNLIKEDFLFHNFCTITGIASQMAYKMGASRINLFGCAFDNLCGRNYAYEPDRNELGNTSKEQRDNMDLVLRAIKKKDIEIVSYGPSSLRVPDIIL